MSYIIKNDPVTNMSFLEAVAHMGQKELIRSDVTGKFFYLAYGIYPCSIRDGDPDWSESWFTDEEVKGSWTILGAVEKVGTIA